MNQTTPRYFIVFLFLAAILSARMLELPFLFDDNELWSYNSRQASLMEMLAVFIPKGGQVLLAEIFYRPLTHLSWWFDGMMWGDWVPGYRLSNVVFHCLGAWIAGSVVVAMGGNRLAQHLAILFFLLHPGHLEAVGWVAARGDLLVTIFMGLGLLGYLRLEGQSRMLAVFGSFLGALLCKEAGLVFPGWIIMTSLLIKKDFREKDTWILYAGLIAMAFAYLGIRYAFFGGLGGYKVGSGGGSSYLDILLNGDLIDRARNALGMLIVPWPGLASGAGRYGLFKIGLYGVIVLPILVATFLNKKECGLLLLWFLCVSMGSYFPSSVIDPGGDLQNSRLVYSGSLAAMVLLGIALSQLVERIPRVATPLLFSSLCVWSLTCGLAQTSWMKVGTILETLPKELKLTFPQLKPSDEVLFVNQDFLRREGVRLFSSTPAAFARAMHPGFGIENVPQADWNHPDSGYRFEPAYWQANRDRLGKDLFYVRWNERQTRVEDLTPFVIDSLAEESANLPVTRLELSPESLLSLVIDKQDVELAIDAASQTLRIKASKGAWIAFKIEPTQATRLVLKWRTSSNSESTLWRVFWTSIENLNWGSPQVSQAMVNQISAQEIITTEIRLRHPLGEKPKLVALRLDPPSDLEGIELLNVQLVD